MFFTKAAESAIAMPGYGTMGANLYRQWMACPRTCSTLLRDEDTLTTDDVLTIRRWANASGWCVALHEDTEGRPQMIELFGPEFGEPADPIGLVYPVENGFQVDEWTGRSWQRFSLGDALVLAEAHL